LVTRRMDVPSKLVVQGLTKRFGRVVAVNEVSFEIREGEFFVIIGPSGCGKTTSLRCVAGLETPDSGSIRVSGSDIRSMPVYKRDVCIVFQDLALFPHMNVFDNVSFGLRMMGSPKDRIEKEVDEVLRLVQLEGLGGRRITELSGGQRQRVALARSLVLKPSILLFDEPIGGAEPELRDRMLAEIKELHRRLGFTALYVTHDQEQAMRLADRIMVMNQGSIEQIGTPEEVYLNPSTLFVAKFVGDINLVRGKVASLDMNEKRVEVETEVGTFLAPIREGVTVGDPVAYAVRPEKPLIGKDAMNCANKFHAKLKDRIYKGSNVEYVFELPNGDEFKVVLAEELEKRVEIGEEAILGCRIEDSVVISKSSVIEGLDIDRVTLGE